MSTGSSRRRKRRWVFGTAVLDEASWTLVVGGRAVALEGKPIEVLHALLLRAGEVVTKEELFDAVWPGVVVVENSLATAVSKLRKALGDQDDAVIETVPRLGYRLAAPVSVESLEAPLAPRFAFVAGDRVPGRAQWRLVEALGQSGAADVWRARHDKTGETRVFKFADAPDRLQALKREATLARLLTAALGKSAPFVPLLEWNFEAAPYFLESADGGDDLIDWAGRAGGLGAVPVATRLQIAVDIARGLAAAHGVGVLHKDLKPANILVEVRDGAPVVRLADFGSGRLIDAEVLSAAHITDLGVGAVDDEDGARSGTLAYRAPELAGTGVPTALGDVYAFGLILFQLMVGDFTRFPAPGWEAEIEDPLLREDIAAAAAGDPARRPQAEQIADRLARLEARRAEAAEAAREAAQAQALRAAEERRRLRRPWIRAAIASLVIGLIMVSGLAVYALHQRNQAVTARELAETGYSFIAEDILASPDPARSSADETVVDAIKRASQSIDRRFAASPGVAARLHLAVARALHQRGDFDTARREYEAADRLFASAGEAESDDAATGRLNRIQMEVVSGQPARLEEAGRLLQREKARLGNRGDAGRVGFALAQAEGSVGFMTDIGVAETAFRRAVRIASAPDSGVPAGQRLKMESSLVLTLMRRGRPAEAEPMAREIVQRSTRLRGADHADTLLTRQHLLQSLVMQGKAAEALRESGPLLAAMQARLGPNHRLTLVLHSTRFESFTTLGRHDEAAAEAERVWQGAAATAGPRSHQALEGQINFASALCRTARRTRGLTVAREALAAVRAAFGADYPLTHEFRFFTAECLVANRAYAEAGAMLAGLDRAKIADITGQPEFGRFVDLTLAEIALGQGDRPRARALLDTIRAPLRAMQDPLIRARLDALSRSLGS